MVDVDELWEWLAPDDDRGDVRIAPGAPGLIRRLLQSFQGDPVGPSQTITLSGTASGLAVPDFALQAVISVETANARLQTDGTLPTTTKGLLLVAGTLFTLTGQATLRAAQMIAVSGSPVVNVLYFT